MSGVLAEPPLVGRESELSELQSCLSSALEGKGTTVFVTGEAGSGKTRLTREFLKTVRDQDITLLSGWCLGEAAVPYFPFMEAFKDYLLQKHEKDLDVETSMARHFTFTTSHDVMLGATANRPAEDTLLAVLSSGRQTQEKYQFTQRNS